MMPGGVIYGHFARPFLVHGYGYERLSASQTASQLASQLASRHAFMPSWIVWVQPLCRSFHE